MIIVLFAHKKILEDLNKYNDSFFVRFNSEDKITSELNLFVRKKCNKDVDTYILVGGTMTNNIGLSKILIILICSYFFKNRTYKCS